MGLRRNQAAAVEIGITRTVRRVAARKAADCDAAAATSTAARAATVGAVTASVAGSSGRTGTGRPLPQRPAYTCTRCLLTVGSVGAAGASI
jgi:hypothetical protein